MSAKTDRFLPLIGVAGLILFCTLAIG